MLNYGDRFCLSLRKPLNSHRLKANAALRVIKYIAQLQMFHMSDSASLVAV